MTKFLVCDINVLMSKRLTTQSVLEKAKELGIGVDDLAGDVQDCKMEEAAAIEGGGIESVVDYLCSRFTVKGAMSRIELSAEIKEEDRVRNAQKSKKPQRG